MHTSDPKNQNDTEKQTTKGFLAITSILFGVIGIFSIIPSLMSVMAFDAPGSENRIIAWVVFLGIFTFSPVCIVSIFCSWTFYGIGKYRSAKIIALSPLINVSILFILFSTSYLIDTPNRIASTNLKKQNKIQRIARFDELCKSDLIKIYGKAENAKTLYFPNDTIFVSDLLLKKKFEYVEVKHVKNIDGKKIQVYTRIVENPDREGRPKWDYSKKINIDHPEAKYEFDYRDISEDNDRKIGNKIREYIVKDRQNNQILAHYKIVNTFEKHCPDFDPSGYKVLTYVLGIMPENELIDFEKNLSEFKNTHQVQ